MNSASACRQDTTCADSPVTPLQGLQRLGSKTVAPMTSSEPVSLSDVLHEVPRLWDFIDGKGHRVLLGTSSKVRKHACELVTKIRPSSYEQPPDISHLTSSRWTQLQVLDVSGSYMDPHQTAQLSSGAWPHLRSLTLARGRPLMWTCNENVFREFKGKWPLLESLIIVFNKVDIAQVKALTEIEWPNLKTLCVEPDSDAIQALMQGKWPQLRDLSLGNGLSDDGLQHFSECRRSTLERLQLLHCEMTTRTMGCIVEAQFSLLGELSLVNVAVQYEDRAGWFTLLAQGRWPLLSTLELEIVDGFSGCVEILASANWTCLQTVILDLCDISAADETAVVEAAWSNIKHLTMAGCFENVQVLRRLYMRKWPLLEYLTLGASPEYFSNISDMARIL